MEKRHKYDKYTEYYMCACAKVSERKRKREREREIYVHLIEKLREIHQLCTLPENRRYIS